VAARRACLREHGRRRAWLHGFRPRGTRTGAGDRRDGHADRGAPRRSHRTTTARTRRRSASGRIHMEYHGRPTVRPVPSAAGPTGFTMNSAHSFSYDAIAEVYATDMGRSMPFDDVGWYRRQCLARG